MRATRVIFTAVCMAALAEVTFAQNLLTNPNFNSNLSGWNFPPQTVWDGTIGNPLPGSGPGSARSAYPFPAGGGFTNTLEQDITSFPVGQALQFGAAVFIPSGQSVPVIGYVSIAYYSDVLCTITIGASATPVTATTNTWTPLSAISTPPPGTLCVGVLGQSGYSGGAASTATVNFDDFFLQGSAPVSALDLRGLLLLGALLGLAGTGLLWLRKG